ncbi:hypothetical protein LCGC14_0714910 [marine sediment metagenome]|uniref:Uncharacterized protein n=1 Tax=marine sediment metagenome TaxID=412755 RepID=A0A0F9SZL4_9ZZZZ
MIKMVNETVLSIGCISLFLGTGSLLVSRNKFWKVSVAISFIGGILILVAFLI